MVNVASFDAMTAKCMHACLITCAQNIQIEIEISIIWVEGDSMRDNFKETEDVRKIDRAFEIVLLIMGIIAAALFEYISHLASIEVLTLSQVTIFFRRAFLPILIVASLWLLSRTFVVNQILKTWIRILVWTCGIFALRTYLFDFIVLAFFPLGFSPYGMNFAMLSFAASNLFLILNIAIIYKYMKAMNHVAFFKTRLWSFQATLASVIGMLLNLFLMPAYFMGLAQFPMLRFLFLSFFMVVGLSSIIYACMRLI